MITVVCPAWQLNGWRPHRWEEKRGGYRCIYCLLELTYREAETFADGLLKGNTEIIISVS
jgi:hypothetical protein